MSRDRAWMFDAGWVVTLSILAALVFFLLSGCTAPSRPLYWDERDGIWRERHSVAPYRVYQARCFSSSCSCCPGKRHHDRRFRGYRHCR